jgi:hypothetical protein
MSLPVTVQHTGSLAGSPATATSAFPSLTEIANTSFQRTYSQRIAGTLSVIGATDLSPLAMPFGSITKAHVVYLRMQGGSLKVKFTSAAGVDQAILVSDEILLHTPNVGDEITAINLVGTGVDCEYVLIGD